MNETLRTRRALGMTQVQFASLFGIHPITVSKWEHNKGRPSPWQRELFRGMRAGKAQGVLRYLRTLLKR